MPRSALDDAVQAAFEQLSRLDKGLRPATYRLAAPGPENPLVPYSFDSLGSEEN